MEIICRFDIVVHDAWKMHDEIAHIAFIICYRHEMALHIAHRDIA